MGIFACFDSPVDATVARAPSIEDQRGGGQRKKGIRSSALFACINSPIFENVLLRWPLCIL